MKRGAALVGVLALAVATLGASSSQAATVTGSAVPSTVTFSTGTLTGLVYQGTATVSSVAGPVDTLEFTTTAADLTDLGITLPCVPIPGFSGLTTKSGITSVTTTSNASVSHATSGMTLYATEVIATVGGSGVDWTVASPPAPTAPVPLGDQTLVNATITARLVSLPTLSAPGLSQQTLFCTP